MPLTPKNWKSFQHYKDRSPAWIKLHRGLLDNVDYYRLSAEAGKALPLLWLLASEKDGIIPDAPEAAFRLRIAEDSAAKIIGELVARGFLVETDYAEPAEQDATPSQRVAKSNGYGSRHIPDEVKRAVWERDGGHCCNCGSDEKLEYDHKHPVSKGGSSDEGNVQLLCRTCNRRKRVQVATQESAKRSLEREKEKKKEGESESRAVAAAPARAPDRFEEFWKAYPRRDGANPRAPAEKKFKALVKSGVDPDMMIAAAAALATAESAKGNVGTAFIPQAMTWLNQSRWSDHAAVAFLLAEKADPAAQLEAAVKMYAMTGRWSRFAGPEPSMIGCRASDELMAKYGMLPDGRKISTLPAADLVVAGE